MHAVYYENAAALRSEIGEGRVRLTIEGQCVSAKNRRQIVPRKGGKGFILVPSKEARKYEREIEKQVPILEPLLTGNLALTATIYYGSERPDLDAGLFLDGLQGRIYENDRQVRELHLYHAIDRTRPRAEILIEIREPELFRAAVA